MIMRAVAEGLVAAVFATAQRHRGLGSDGDFDRRELTALMGTVTEGLVGRSAAGAPPVIAGRQLHDIGGFFRDPGFRHSGVLHSAGI
jgi:hypothetical protein